MNANRDVKINFRINNLLLLLIILFSFPKFQAFRNLEFSKKLSLEMFYSRRTRVFTLENSWTNLNIKYSIKRISSRNQNENPRRMNLRGTDLEHGLYADS